LKYLEDLEYHPVRDDFFWERSTFYDEAGNELTPRSVFWGPKSAAESKARRALFGAVKVLQ
jgi:hypothetical protein